MAGLSAVCIRQPGVCCMLAYADWQGWLSAGDEEDGSIDGSREGKDEECRVVSEFPAASIVLSGIRVRPQ